MGRVMIKRGYFVDAQRYFDLACSMDPYNREYKAAQERLCMRANSYAGGYQTTQASGQQPVRHLHRAYMRGLSAELLFVNHRHETLKSKHGGPRASAYNVRGNERTRRNTPLSRFGF